MCRCYYGKLVWKGRVNEILKIFSYDELYLFSRGLIFGVWSACASVGNILGAVLAAAFLGYGYEYPFLICCVLLVCCAVVCLFAIVPNPEDVGMFKTNFIFLLVFENIIFIGIQTKDDLASVVGKNVNIVCKLSLF